MLIILAVWLALGVAVVAVSQRRGMQSDRAEKIGGGMIVVGLIGLGVLFARKAK